MKKVILTIVVLLISVILAVTILEYSNIKRSLRIINDKDQSVTYSEYFENYFFKHGEFPVRLSEVFDFYIDIPDDSIFIHNFFSDPFLPDSLLVYIPRINSTGNVVGFVLISRGPDKVINNIVKDFSSNNSQIENMNLYNKSDIPGYENESNSNLIHMNYTPFTSLTGNSDLFISSNNIEDLYKQNIRILTKHQDINTNSKLLDWIKERNFKNDSTLYPVLLKSIVPIQFTESNQIDTTKNSTLIITEGGYKFNCLMNDSNILNFEKSNSESKVVGKIDSIDVQQKIIYLKHCIIIDDDAKE